MDAEFTLPGGWLDAGGACHRRGVLRPLAGSDEEWIHSVPASRPRAAFVTDLLARCVLRIGGRRATQQVVRELTIGDREFLVLKLYQATFGDRYAMVLTCPRAECGAKMDLDLLIEQIPVEERPLAASYRLELLEPEPLTVEFRLPRGADQERLAELGDDATAQRDGLLDACVVGEAPPAWSREALIAAIETRAPGVESELEVSCPDCGLPFEVELDLASLLLQEVERGRAAFDRELHLLAFHYHWPLRELYSLTRPRRHRFLRLLMDELGARAG